MEKAKNPMTYIVCAVWPYTGDAGAEMTAVIVNVIDTAKIPGFQENPHQAVGKALQAAARDAGRDAENWDSVFGIPATTLAEHGLAWEMDNIGILLTNADDNIGESDFR